MHDYEYAMQDIHARYMKDVVAKIRAEDEINNDLRDLNTYRITKQLYDKRVEKRMAKAEKQKLSSARQYAITVRDLRKRMFKSETHFKKAIVDMLKFDLYQHYLALCREHALINLLHRKAGIIASALDIPEAELFEITDRHYHKKGSYENYYTYMLHDIIEEFYLIHLKKNDISWNIKQGFTRIIGKPLFRLSEV